MQQKMLNRFQKWAINKAYRYHIRLVPSGNWVRKVYPDGTYGHAIMTYSYVDQLCHGTD